MAKRKSKIVSAPAVKKSHFVVRHKKLSAPVLGTAVAAVAVWFWNLKMGNYVLSAEMAVPVTTVFVAITSLLIPDHKEA